ncbi:MAG: hypothetical protein FWE21_01400 [Defluviitaleaceae bacterium]|nr:hypothetical protein [Defluviitaleaceae bacterium]
MLEKLEIILCLLAGLAVTVVNVVIGRDLPDVLLHLLVSMVAFYILGLIVKMVLRKIFPPKTEEEELLAQYVLEDFEDEPNPAEPAFAERDEHANNEAS